MLPFYLYLHVAVGRITNLPLQLKALAIMPGGQTLRDTSRPRVPTIEDWLKDPRTIKLSTHDE
jgi:hypothetical protein